ncbi:uncharacterized protein LOC144630885 [Oculina patagonica]
MPPRTKSSKKFNKHSSPENTWLSKFCRSQDIPDDLKDVLVENQITTKHVFEHITEQDLADMGLVVGQKILLRRVISLLRKELSPPSDTAKADLGGSGNDILPGFNLAEEISKLEEEFQAPQSAQDTPPSETAPLAANSAASGSQAALKSPVTPGEKSSPEGYLTQLDSRAKLISAAAYATSTLNTRRSQWRTYVRFCTTYHLVPVPAKEQTIIRFLIHLSYYCKYSTVINYLTAINVLHRHFGFNVTFQEMFPVKLILHGLRRILGDTPAQKLPMTPDILSRLHPQLTARTDSGFWAAMLIGFYTFFRKSNLVPKTANDFDPAKNLCRNDIIVRPWGLVICVR